MPGHIGIVSRKDKSSNSTDTFIPMFTATLFTTANTQKQPKCPLIDERIKKGGVCVCVYTHTHIYNMEYYSAIKNNEIVPFAATWMDLVISILSEASQRKTNSVRYHFCVEY